MLECLCIFPARDNSNNQPGGKCTDEELKPELQGKNSEGRQQQHRKSHRKLTALVHVAFQNLEKLGGLDTERDQTCHDRDDCKRDHHESVARHTLPHANRQQGQEEERREFTCGAGGERQNSEFPGQLAAIAQDR